MKYYIETERLILRELLATDDEGMFELDSNPEVHKYLGNKPVTKIEECRETIQVVQKQYIENGIGRFAMIEKSTENFVGWSGIKFIKEPVNNHIIFYEVGYRLIPKYWGKGYATESTISSLNFAFEKLNAKDVYGINQAIAALDAAVRSGGDGVEQDLHFHRAIADAAQNPFLISTLDYLRQFLQGAIAVTRANEARRFDFARQVQREHLAIAQAISAGDAPKARLAAARHMNNAIKRIEQANPAFWEQEGVQLAKPLVSGAEQS